METNIVQQEVLLITGTSFSSRQWSEKNDSGTPNRLTEKERLESACWNGLLKEMLPEVFSLPATTKTLYLWQIRKTASFIELELGELPSIKEKEFSIDPYSFLETQSYN